MLFRTFPLGFGLSPVFLAKNKTAGFGKRRPFAKWPEARWSDTWHSAIAKHRNSQAIWRLGLLFFSGTLRREYLCFYQKGRLPWLQEGKKAPLFTLPDQDGNPVNLSDFAGKKIVLYFYPRDNTPGCTRQACAFAQSWEDYSELGAVVIGISKDSVASHQKFAQKFHLPFLLLSDPDLQAIRAYDVWQEKKLYGKTSMGVVRTTYLIDEDGTIEKAMPKVKPDTNAAEILAYLREKKERKA